MLGTPLIGTPIGVPITAAALGYGADWREMWQYYAKAEQALSISGPVSYPWGPKRPCYPYRAHELNGAAKLRTSECATVRCSRPWEG